MAVFIGVLTVYVLPLITEYTVIGVKDRNRQHVHMSKSEHKPLNKKRETAKLNQKVIEK